MISFLSLSSLPSQIITEKAAFDLIKLEMLLYQCIRGHGVLHFVTKKNIDQKSALQYLKILYRFIQISKIIQFLLTA